MQIEAGRNKQPELAKATALGGAWSKAFTMFECRVMKLASTIKAATIVTVNAIHEVRSSPRWTGAAAEMLCLNATERVSAPLDKVISLPVKAFRAKFRFSVLSAMDSSRVMQVNYCWDCCPQ